MGTSSSYSGPVGTSSLLPPWADGPQASRPLDREGAPPDDLKMDTPFPQISWSVPKTLLSRLSNGLATGLSAVALASLGRSYVQASGGPQNIASSAQAGRAASARLGGFLADGVNNGFQVAAKKAGLEPFLGSDADYVLTAFIEMIAPNGALREEAVARIAMIETCTELFDRYDVASSNIDALDTIDADGLREIVALSVTNYVNVRLQEELVNRIERGVMNEEDANELMGDIKDFISGVVNLDLSKIDVLTVDWNGPEGHQVVEHIYEAGYEMLGGAE